MNKLTPSDYFIFPEADDKIIDAPQQFLVHPENDELDEIKNKMKALESVNIETNEIMKKFKSEMSEIKVILPCLLKALESHKKLAEDKNSNEPEVLPIIEQDNIRSSTLTPTDPKTPDEDTQFDSQQEYFECLEKEFDCLEETKLDNEMELSDTEEFIVPENQMVEEEVELYNEMNVPDEEDFMIPETQKSGETSRGSDMEIIDLSPQQEEIPQKKKDQHVVFMDRKTFSRCKKLGDVSRILTSKDSFNDTIGNVTAVITYPRSTFGITKGVYSVLLALNIPIYLYKENAKNLSDMKKVYDPNTYRMPRKKTVLIKLPELDKDLKNIILLGMRYANLKFTIQMSDKSKKFVEAASRHHIKIESVFDAEAADIIVVPDTPKHRKDTLLPDLFQKIVKKIFPQLK